MTALPSDQTTRAVELASAGATRHAELDRRMIAVIIRRISESGAESRMAGTIREKLNELLAYGISPTVELVDAVTRELIARAARMDARVAEGSRLEAGREAQRRAQSEVYFISHGDLVKIGVSLDAGQRVKGMQLPPGARLLGVIRGDRSVEQGLHQRFAHLRHAGTEWFTRAPDLDAFLRDALA